MKHLLPSLSILFVLLIFSLANSAYLNTLTDTCQMHVSQADALAAQGRWEEAYRVIEKSCRDWSSRQPYLHIILDRTVVTDILTAYHRAAAFALTQEPSEFRAEAAQLQTQLSFLARSETLSLESLL
ncbi:MAG: DUF4363 family protein [Oscillibacter sp.]|nr:DUF4363 family protein [Oscillibacter sp.]